MTKKSEKCNDEHGLHEWLDRWLHAGINQRISENSYQCYEYSVRRIKKWIVDIPLEKITELDIQEALNLMADIGVSKSAIHKTQVVLNQAFNIAIRHGYMKYNLIHYTFMPKNAKEKEVLPLTIEEQKRLEKECINDIHGDLFLFLLNTGLRRAELCNLKWQDYDRKEGVLYIRKSKTQAGIRMIPLLEICRQIIELQPKVNEYIFVRKNVGTPITPILLRRSYERLRIKAEIPNLTNHVCRHTFATRLIERGAEPKAVAALLGHTDIVFTLNRYVKAQPEFLTKQIYLLETKADNSLLSLSAINS